jgi:hypothetical protein
MYVRGIFQEFFNGKPNIMTPEPVEYGQLANGLVLYEISTGTGMSEEPIFGVTFLVREGGKWMRAPQGYNKFARTLADARQAVLDMRRQLSGNS